ncbi:MAG TPA: alpha-hydroxy acid oxidase [Solirubrobacteraceae bacterium]
MPDANALEAAARAALDPAVHAFYAGGTGPADAAAWARVGLRPRVLRDVAAVDTATTVLGVPVASPVLAAPVALLGLAHPGGEAAWAAGVAAAGGLRVLSTRTTTAIAAVADAAPGAPWWFQVYVMRDRGLTAELVRRAAAAGAGALVLTGDTPRVAARAPLEVPAGGYMPDLPGDLRRDPRAFQDPRTTFADVAWLREVSGGLPVLVKGVLRGDDARACLAAGAAGVIVSNHGGRQLAGAVAPAAALPEVADAVAGEAEVLVDGGIATGVDVLRALALGARAVLVGRPLVWALATGGGDGVRAFLDELRAELEEALALAGATSPADAGRDLVQR